MAIPQAWSPMLSRMASTLYGGAAAFLVVYVLGSAISFGVHIFLARSIGATSYGYFAYATHWMAILLLLCNVGLKSTLIGFVAAYRARCEWSLLRGLLRSATIWTVSASAVVLTLSLVVVQVVRAVPDELARTLLLVALAMPFMALTDVWSSATRGLGSVIRSQLPASIVQHMLLGGLLLGAFLLNGLGGGAADAGAAFLAATIGTCCVSWLFLHRLVCGVVPPAAPDFARGAWADVAAGNLLIALLQAARAPLVVVIAGAHVEPQQLGFLAAALKLANVAALGLTGITGFASPEVARYFALGDTASLQRLGHLSARASLAVALLMAVILAAAGERFLGFFGDGFSAAYPALLVLLAGELVAASVGPVGYFLTLTGRHRAATWIEAGTSVLVLVLAQVLIPRIGILGAAEAVALGATVRNIAMVVAVWRLHGLRSLIV